MSPESLKALKRWEAEKIKQLGFDGFQKYRKELFSRGKILHTNIQTYLETKDTSKLQFASNTHEKMWQSVEHVLPKIGTLYASEVPVHHPFLRYRGILDSLATYHDIPTIFEWKTSEKLKPTVAHTYDNPLQAIAYFACLQFDQAGLVLPPVKEVILVIAYEDGSKANVHILESSFRAEIWKKFLKRLELFWSQQAN
ncbi:PREDICTED: mitochondrial genome maintenance exonuclease 1-like [Rhagoletis zephyria]|uniref:mitochondrial genome maintenance exonuclease 1-like n=1 Tax=Rhagoletis zephyria TaxID=28612 RepID=UPI0008116DD0|nr:PREDICTED: mitochondrial genome maintenance exonuclease 1-like [Rhagoletis zephyria]